MLKTDFINLVNQELLRYRSEYDIDLKFYEF